VKDLAALEFELPSLTGEVSTMLQIASEDSGVVIEEAALPS
jgi:hypothetical protein